MNCGGWPGAALATHAPLNFLTFKTFNSLWQTDSWLLRRRARWWFSRLFWFLAWAPMSDKKQNSWEHHFSTALSNSPPKFLLEQLKKLLENKNVKKKKREKKCHFCLVLLQVPKCFVPVQIFWASPKIWLHLVPAQKPILLNANHLFVWHKMFVTCTICE